MSIFLLSINSLKWHYRQVSTGNNSKLFDFIVSFLSPLIFGKILIMYFGTNYSNYPGDGYGYGLLAAVLFTLLMAGRFLWKYRNYQDR